MAHRRTEYLRMQVELRREVRDALVDGDAEHGGDSADVISAAPSLGATRVSTLLGRPGDHPGSRTRPLDAPILLCQRPRRLGRRRSPSFPCRAGRYPTRSSPRFGAHRACARHRSSTRPIRWGTTTSTWPSTPATSFTTGVFAGVDPRWEWDPHLLASRQALERPFEEALRDAVPSVQVEPGVVEDALRAIVDDDSGPPLARTIERHADLTQVREFLAAPVGLPVEGSRSSLLGGAAALGKAEGGADRGAGGRVRGRPPGPNARDPVRRGDAGAGPR